LVMPSKGSTEKQVPFICARCGNRFTRHQCHADRGVRFCSRECRTSRLSVEFLLERAIPEPNSGCWLWTECTTKTGYGSLTFEGRPVVAHRLAYRCKHGSIAADMVVRHICDVRSCVNPDHLILGTQAQNIADCVARGRQAKGTTIPHAKMTPDKVRAFRSLVASGVSQRAAARQFGISPSVAQAIAAGRRWAHVS